jgi:hypothetical protein
MSEIWIGLIIGFLMYVITILTITFYGAFIFKYSADRLRSIALTKFSIDPDRPNGDTEIMSAAWQGNKFAVVFKVIEENGKETTINKLYDVEEGTCPTGFSMVNGKSIANGLTCLNI